MKLVTWNIQWCRGFDGRVDPQRIVDARARHRRLRRAVPAGGRGQLPGLTGSDGEDQFALLAALLPGFTPIAAPPVDVAGADGRGAALRQHDPEPAAGRAGAARAAAVARRPGACAACRGCCSRPSSQTPFGPLRVMTTHLEYYSQAQRAAQVEALRALPRRGVRRTPSTTAPAAIPATPFQAQPHTVSAILTGDFNLRPTIRCMRE